MQKFLTMNDRKSVIIYITTGSVNKTTSRTQTALPVDGLVIPNVLTKKMPNATLHSTFRIVRVCVVVTF